MKTDRMGAAWRRNWEEQGKQEIGNGKEAGWKQAGANRGRQKTGRIFVLQRKSAEAVIIRDCLIRSS